MRKQYYGVLSAIVCLGMAQSAHAETPSAQAEWPNEVVVTVGDIRTRIDGPKMWTLSGIEYQNAEVATQDSAYGTVFTIRNVGHLGTAHFLDVPGKPGQVEKEDVKSVTFTVDGKPVEQWSPKMNLSGKSFRMERRSAIRTTELESSVTIANGVLTEAVKLHAKAAVDLQKAHPTMYAWSPGDTHYMVGNDGGIIKNAVFPDVKGADVTSHKDWKWMAVFNPTTGKGSVCYLRQQPDNGKATLLLVNAHKSYRKMALMSFIDEVMPEGFTGTYSTSLGFFTAAKETWENEAMACMKKLSEQKEVVEIRP